MSSTHLASSGYNSLSTRQPLYAVCCREYTLLVINTALVINAGNSAMQNHVPSDAPQK